MSPTRWTSWRAAAALLILLAAAATARAQLPVSGVPVPELQDFDDAMQSYMDANGLKAGVLAVSRDDCIVYQRGFGYLIEPPGEIDLPENTPMRLASLEKPITAAAIVELVSDGQVAASDFVFDLGQGGVTLLPHTPWSGVGDLRLDDVTLMNPFNHRGGWDRGVFGDPQFMAVTISTAMGIASPPGRDATVRYMLSQAQQYDPGITGGVLTDGGSPYTCMDGSTTNCYSNFGYMVLAEVIEEVTGQSHLNYVRGSILTPAMWVPSTELFFGRTFRADQSPREPIYKSPATGTNVFDPGGPSVSSPYGGWEHEVMVGHGNLVGSAAPLLVYMDNYWVGVGGLSGSPLGSSDGGGVHTGGLRGTSTVMWQRSDGTNIVVLFNQSKEDGSPSDYSGDMGQQISDLITAGGITWPSFCVDGHWVDFNETNLHQVGGHDAPFHSMAEALSGTTAGTKLRFKPGTTTWTGQLNERLRLDAPYGTVRIGG